jgi:hypothetical protein
VRDAINDQATHATDAFTTIVIKGDRLFAFADQALIDDIEHLKKRHIRARYQSPERFEYGPGRWGLSVARR